MTTTPDADLGDVLVPSLDHRFDGFQPESDPIAADVDPTVVALADTELVGPDDTHLGIIEVELLPVDVHDDLQHLTVDLDRLEPAHDDPAELSAGLDLDFGVG